MTAGIEKQQLNQSPINRVSAIQEASSMSEQEL